MAVDAGFPAALWAMYAATGIRPEWIVPVLYSESGLNPAIQNQAGYPYYGINQISGTWLQARGVSPSTYQTWSSSQQLTGAVIPFMKQQIAALGITPKSGTRLYQMNFLPATLKTATSLSSVLAVKPSGGCPAGLSSSVYCANPGFDWQHKGTITVGDLAHAISKAASASYSKQVIAQAYAAAPSGVGSETDPVYGLDFSGAPSPFAERVLIAAAVALPIAVIVTLAWRRGIQIPNWRFVT